jgi:hypothetical protein
MARGEYEVSILGENGPSPTPVRVVAGSREEAATKVTQLGEKVCSVRLIRVVDPSSAEAALPDAAPIAPLPTAIMSDPTHDSVGIDSAHTEQGEPDESPQQATMLATGPVSVMSPWRVTLRWVTLCLYALFVAGSLATAILTLAGASASSLRSEDIVRTLRVLLLMMPCWYPVAELLVLLAVSGRRKKRTDGRSRLLALVKVCAGLLAFAASIPTLLPGIQALMRAADLFSNRDHPPDLIAALAQVWVGCVFVYPTISLAYLLWTWYCGSRVPWVPLPLVLARRPNP